MKKQLLGLVLSLCMIISCMPCVVSAEDSGTCGENLTWVLDDNGTVTISGTGDMKDYSRFGQRSPFYCNSNIKSVVIANGITSIGNHTFYNCRELTSVTIGNEVISIGDGAFSNCSGLTSVTIGNGVTSIGYGAFEGCSSLTSINVKGNNQNYCSVDGNLFSKDKKTLIQYAIGKTDTNYIIPNSVTSIGSSAFSGCSGLTSVTIPNSVTSIGYGAFWNCSNLTDVIMGNGITSIEGATFYNCVGLTSITISNSVTNIEGGFSSGSGREYGAFEGCSNLTSITIPSSVTSISGWCGFNGCDNLDSVYISDLTAWLNIDFGGSGSNPLKNKLYINNELTTEIIIPDGITEIKDCVFSNFKSLKSITIPDSVIAIGYGAFEDCSGLTDVYYSGSETEWNKIDISDSNGALIEATIHYNSVAPIPTTIATVTKTETDMAYTFEVNAAERYENCYVYAAVYDEKDRLIKVKGEPLEIMGNTTVSISKSEKDKMAKVFIWANTHQPIIKTEEFTLTAE